MKNLMVYLSPNRTFDEQALMLLRIQVENSIELGWRPEDIVVITNFFWTFANGIKSWVIQDKWFCDFAPINSKLSAVVGAFEADMFDNDVYWLHDLDAFQQEPFDERILDPFPWDMGVCYFGRLKKWSGGSVFFIKEARDIFEKAYKKMYQKKMIDEDALTEVAFDDEKIHNRIQRLNPTYNFVPFNIGTCWQQADPKPIRVVHFNPWEGVRKQNIPNLLKFYMGENRLEECFLTERLITLFERYGIK